MDVVGHSQSSRTMRIDLIPDIPAGPRRNQREQVRIGASEQVHGRASMPTETEAEVSHFQRLLQRLYDAAVIADLEGRIQDVNVRAEEFFLRQKSEFTDLTVFDLISGADEALIETLCKNLENERYTLIQAYCLRSDGSTFPAEIAVSKLELQETHLCFFVRDVTVRRQAEEMLITEHNAIQNSGNGIAIADLAGELEYVNPMAERMWASEPDAMLGLPFAQLLENRDAADAIVKKLLEGERHAWSGEATARRFDGSTFDVQVAGSCNRNPDGEMLGCVFSFVDISDRKRAQEAERQSEQRRVMLESLGAACHHVGQPATMIMGNLEMLSEHLQDSDPQVRELVQRSLKSMEELSQVLRKLTDVTEYETMEYLGDRDREGGAGSRIIKI